MGTYVVGVSHYTNTPFTSRRAQCKWGHAAIYCVTWILNPESQVARLMERARQSTHTVTPPLTCDLGGQLGIEEEESHV